MSEKEILNKWLETYGKIENNPLFRLVWSNSIMEHRRGWFRDFTDGGLFIREVFETRLARKYNYLHEKWILEAYSRNANSSEVPGTEGGDYVPVYVFQDKRGNSLPVTRKVLEFIVGCCLGRVERDKVPSAEYLEEVEIKSMEESMDDHPSEFSTRPGPQRNSIAYTKGLKDVTSN